jgi:hypothetical protein
LPFGRQLADIPGVSARSLEAFNANESSLKALGALRDLVQSPWPENVRFEDVNAAVEGFTKTASPQDGAVMRRYVSVRARMEGQKEVARQLLPPGETQDATSVLRDLKAMEEFSATPPPESPFGDLPLPEPEPVGIKASVREALDEDLPGLGDELPAAELRARRGAFRAIETSAGTHFHLHHLHLHNLTSVASTSEPDDREDEVERQLGREQLCKQTAIDVADIVGTVPLNPYICLAKTISLQSCRKLTPEERLLVRRLLRTKKTAEVVAALRSLVRK